MEKLERMSSSGSVKRPTSVHSSNSLAPMSPIANVASMSTSFHEDSFSNNPDDYDIRQPIGYGSSAVVYNAYYKPLSKRIAIKVIDLDMFERNQIDELRRETQVMALCKHPNVLRVNGAFVADSKLYIVTPYLSAGSCLDIMKTAYPDGFDEVTIATILKQALQGLDYLHKNGHIHRDVKAGNLLVDEDGSVLLADFGVSSSLMENGDRRGMRKTFVGTPCWMAPEVMEQAGYDYKADIWSFGITAIELATGHAPFAKYPPIKVLMLTLSNDPPTLDRESTKHRYSKLFKEMIDTCLQKDPSRRPTAEKLLNHSFFKQAKKKSYLVSGILHNLPPLEQRPPKKAAPKQVMPQKGVSWDFDGDDTADYESEHQQHADSEVAAPRTRAVTFETPAPTAVPAATGEDGLVPPPPAHVPSSPHLSTPSAFQQGGATDKPVKKSRFVIEESPSVSAGVSSPNLGHVHQLGSEIHLSPSSASLVSPAVSSHVSTPLSSVQAASGQHLQGLGVTSTSAPATAGSVSTAGELGLPEVKKGRFSVKDTSLSITSPSASALKAMGANESLLSPSRSLSSSPVDMVPESVKVSGGHPHLLPESSGTATPSSERKSRFEVHHNHSGHSAGTPLAAPSTEGSELHTGSHHAASSTLSRDSSQSRVASELGGGPLSREGSATRVSRFSIETGGGGLPPSHGIGHDSPAPPSASVAGVANGVPAPAQTYGAPPQTKRSRFQVSSVDGRSAEGTPDVGGSSVNSTPNTSPSASLLRGQLNLNEPQTVQNVYAHLDTLYRQNEQQRAILSELFAGLGIKTLPTGGTLSHEGSNIGSPAISRIAGGSSVSGVSSVVPAVAAGPASATSSTVTGGLPSGSTGMLASGGSAASSSSGSVHRVDAAQQGLQRQLQTVIKENESLRRENEALKREIERLRRSGGV